MRSEEGCRGYIARCWHYKHNVQSADMSGSCVNTLSNADGVIVWGLHSNVNSSKSSPTCLLSGNRYMLRLPY